MQSSDGGTENPPEDSTFVVGKIPVVSDFFRALVLLSRVPVFRINDFRPALIARSVWCWPLVGLFLAGIALIPAQLAAYLTESAVVFAIVAVLALVLLTGAMHEDGLADCADGFGGGIDRARKLEIMRDSRIGTYGVVALVLCLGLRIALLVRAADAGQAVVLLLVMAVVSRGAMPVLMTVLLPARDNGLGKNAGQPKWRHVMLGVAIAIAIVWLLSGPVVMVSVVVAAMLATALMGGIARWQIGGQTGDVLGATQMVAELFVAIGFVATMGNI
ncbi:adenosylcobinamide-GDP ribazoletransferase [Thalassospira lucentensis]|nr:adenosylcobinamide-GDP ribazoletransferase [Thalassospira lucentensis]